MKHMRQTVRGWKLHRQTLKTLADLAQQCNSTTRGWWNYYGAFYQTAMRKLVRYLDQRFEQWARRKYKTLLRHKRRSMEWLRKMKNEYPRMFHYWQAGGSRVG
ncbi:group II intron maturase-specific domain-containing protein [Mycoavidus cysteinexigens]|uniref:group II intron maturase-specific domain-containing protein n=1 Tax=Mycoavidus cysteinexigens TaxID=1553431 RepID=UPI000F83A051|nr:group II intron maturase-specific domain-containing protein [Mycoavidus cysteinexigens]